jgi:hypothetical protein
MQASPALQYTPSSWFLCFLHITWEAKEKLEGLRNPLAFRERDNSVFPQRPHVQELWEESHFHPVPYCEVWPDGATKEMVDLAREISRPIHTTAHMVFSIPKTVYETNQVIRLKLALDFSGGGGVSPSHSSQQRIPHPHKRRGSCLGLQQRYS